jgi:quercetin dioxygenase-like cupin family protein
MKTFAIVSALTCSAMVSGAVLAAECVMPPKPTAMVMNATQSQDVKWGPAPPMLPPGAQMAVMSGDPAAKGFVSVRASVPAGYTVPPHTHPTDEHVTVLSGSMAFGMGDKMDPAMESAVGPGGYFVAQAQMHHYARATEASVIQIDMEGPFDITYINPADDPRSKSK